MEEPQYDILIVDDSKFIIKLLTDILKLKGYSCRSVKNITLAMKELDKSLPKLIFLDVNLPDSNSYEFCKILKSTEKFNGILIYYFTGIDEAEIAIKTLETRADGYLKKPFDLSDFNDIFEHLDQSNTTAKL
ncbi:MAG: response regulator [Promethearchaeota archaeon]|nr:MAG: response regulator [Candidatus Lokiarchaeota archaeon]